jgi:cytochrome c oxidase subunit IV
MSQDRHFSVDKVFIYLFALTAGEVLWGYAGGVWWDWGKFMLWGGLLTFAAFKGWLIAAYFMHLKFEGWIVKGLIVPTPFLVLVIFGYVIPDVADKDGPLVHPIGSQYDPETGVVEEEMNWLPEHGEEH